MLSTKKFTLYFYHKTCYAFEFVQYFTIRTDFLRGTYLKKKIIGVYLLYNVMLVSGCVFYFFFSHPEVADMTVPEYSSVSPKNKDTLFYNCNPFITLKEFSICSILYS